MEHSHACSFTYCPWQLSVHNGSNDLLQWRLYGAQSINIYPLTPYRKSCQTPFSLFITILILYILFQILFPYRSLQDIEYSSLCYTVGPCCLSILYIVVCICQSKTPNLYFPLPFPFSNHKFVFYVCESIALL